MVRNFYLTKLPLVMLRLLSSLSSSLHMLVFTCLANLFAYNMPMQRKYVRLTCVFHVFHDALFMLQFLSFMWASLKSQCLAKNALKKSACWETTQYFSLLLFNKFCIYFMFRCVFMFYLVFVPSRTYKVTYDWVDLIQLKNRNFALMRNNSIKHRDVILHWLFLLLINRQIF